VAKRSGVLEFAVLGLLHESPMHGYELRKRLNVLLGSLRVFSYGTLYPCLKDLVARGLLVEDHTADVHGHQGAKSAPALGGAAAAPRRSKIVYRLTPDGEEHFAQLLSDAGPSAWEDENFGVHFAFFGRTDAAIRLRILEGRRSRLEERLDLFRQSVTRTTTHRRYGWSLLGAKGACPGTYSPMSPFPVRRMPGGSCLPMHVGGRSN